MFLLLQGLDCARRNKHSCAQVQSRKIKLENKRENGTELVTYNTSFPFTCYLCLWWESGNLRMLLIQNLF